MDKKFCKNKVEKNSAFFINKKRKYRKKDNIYSERICDYEKSTISYYFNFLFYKLC